MSGRALATDIKSQFHPRFRTWTAQGASPRVATVLALAGVDTPEQLARLGRSFFEGRKDVGPKTMEAIERLAGWPPRTAQDAIARALRLSIPDDEEGTAAAGDAICALARSGFAIVARSAPAGSR